LDAVSHKLCSYVYDLFVQKISPQLNYTSSF